MPESLQEMEQWKKELKQKRLGRRDMLEDLTKRELVKFIRDMDRYERIENTRVYIKGIRACLIALGYDEEWVNDDFYELLLAEYDD